MKSLHGISFVLVIIGGLNWLLVGIASFDVVAKIFGADSIVSKIIYILVGLSAVYLVFTHKKTCKNCEPSSSGAPMM
ncbi:MAG: DUF378 domain-containing protein [Candidatus Paceibacterota bacterium]|jgi:hypothetical protein